eukprot:jgi/Chlat1/1279/Chrsp117S01705
MLPAAQALSVGFPAINSASPEWLPLMVWSDFWLAVIFNMVIPQYLFVWALRSGNAVIKRANLAYWQACSLLLLTVYLQITGWAPGFATGFASIPATLAALWLYRDLSADIEAGSQDGVALNKVWQRAKLWSSAL